MQQIRQREQKTMANTSHWLNEKEERFIWRDNTVKKGVKRYIEWIGFEKSDEIGLDGKWFVIQNRAQR